MQFIKVAMKVAYLENISPTTMIEPWFLDLGNPIMNSTVTLSHGCSDRPLSYYGSTLFCWYKKQILT